MVKDIAEGTIDNPQADIKLAFEESPTAWHPNKAIGGESLQAATELLTPQYRGKGYNP